MTLSEIKMLLIFRTVDAYTTVASWLFVITALFLVIVDSNIDKLRNWSITVPGQLTLTAIGCAITATAVILFILGLADVACRDAATIAVK